MSIRQSIMDAVIARLETITQANGYSRQVGPGRVYPVRKVPNKLPNSAIVVYQGRETIDGPVANDRYRASLLVSVGFYAADASRDPDKEAIEFLSDIQLCMGQGGQSPDQNEFQITTTSYGTGNPATIIVECLEIGNEISSTDAKPGEIFGQCDFALTYFRNLHDPAKH